VHAFNGTDGQEPFAGLVQATNGDLYGTTSARGITLAGTVFKISSNGTLTTLHNFNGGDNTDGAYPDAALVQATNGNFYGTTTYGGTMFLGAVFKMTESGTLNVLDSLDQMEGEYPYAGLVQATNGDLYGTTTYSSGTVFKITPSGTLTPLYGFCSETCVNGEFPYAGLLLANDGNLYGTNIQGGACGGDCGGGTVFKITPSGALTTLHSFDGTDGAFPYAGLVQATSGAFYGTTCGCTLGPAHGRNDGASYDYGTVFRLSVSLGPFVKTLPAAGNLGAEVGILGTALTGATSVAFNGTPAQFSVPLPSLILTHVPTGATTGKIEVTLPGQKFSSNVPFYVLK